MTALPYAELHAFPDGDAPYTGNPAGVMLLATPLPDADCLGIAASNNLAETAYLEVLPGEWDLWRLRWFTPEAEVDLCGHATLAAAVWLFDEGHVQGNAARFETRSGRLTVSRHGAEAYAMDFPSVAFRPADGARPGLAQALGHAAPEQSFDIDPIHGAPYQMLVYADQAAVENLKPDFSALAAAGANVIATAPGQAVDVVSRFFAPLSGVPEDPVTGSAHCTLAPYWAERLGRQTLSARQIGPRPGALTMRVEPGKRITLIGTARRYLDGVITL
ncbi:MAG: PhzF family phenazine biosynthesis protein [Alphaproteobacteria bacterium]